MPCATRHPISVKHVLRAASRRCAVRTCAIHDNLGAATVATLGAVVLLASPASADLNKFEAGAGGEFGMGSAQQYGEADIKGRDFSNMVRSHDRFDILRGTLNFDVCPYYLTSQPAV
jgi:hypothetical protein